MTETKPITNRRPTKEDANGFGLVQYYRNDFGVWGYDYWYNVKTDGWAHTSNWRHQND